ncbi:MAG: VWA domain-containing protein [Planctomycetaceae bacterium]|nr:VWA domain-containing protein [Planctomycetaceae bacterium]
MAALPLFWWWWRRRVGGLGRRRGAAALGLRSLVWLLVVAACSEMQWVRTDARLTVIYLLDRSQSIPQAESRAMVDYVNRSLAGRRLGEDWVGVVVFGREARTESPPQAERLTLSPDFLAIVDSGRTNLAGALRLAEASFPAGMARRIVVVSDGNANVGDVYDEARAAVDQGIGIDVVPVVAPPLSDVLVEKVTLPAIARRGEPFDVQVLLNHVGADVSKPVAGTLELARRRGGETTLLGKQRVEWSGGKRTFQVQQTLDAPDFYEYEASFTPDDALADPRPQNNRASNFTQLAGSGRVLLIENFQDRGRHARLVEALRREKLEVVVMPSNRLFQSPAELLAFDTVVLADVPRSGGDSADDVVAFGDEQVRMLATNVSEMGSGLVMLGGPNSFGAGGWANSPVEAAMPVDFQIKNVKVVAGGALALLIDSSGSMMGPKLDMSRRAAAAAVRVLGAKDSVGVVAFDSSPHWIVPLAPIDSLTRVLRQIGGISAGGGTDMKPALDEAYEALLNSKGAVKHLIALTDGLTAGEGLEKQAAEMKARGITTTTVAVGPDSNGLLLDGMARGGGGRFYPLGTPEEIPKIFMLEAMRVARPLVYERAEGIDVRRESPTHEVLRGIDGPLPPLTGMILTQRKSSSLAQSLLANPKFADEGTGTVAAVWSYGLGRSAVWTTDCGANWAAQWNDWPQFDRLLTGLIRWTMRPPPTSGRFAMSAEIEDGIGQLIMTAVDESGEAQNLLDPQGTLVGPDLTTRPLRLEQIAPGRYSATFPATDVGSYFIVVRPAPGQPTVRAGAAVSYSPELRDREPNLALLDSLATLKSADGVVGTVAPPVTAASNVPRQVGDFFRRNLPSAVGRRDAWPPLVLVALILFVADVFVRRVAVDFAPLTEAFRRVVGRPAATAAAAERGAALSRLTARKREVVRKFDKLRATVDRSNVAPADGTAEPSSPSSVDSKTSYAARLRQAKLRARAERRPVDYDRSNSTDRADDSPNSPQDRA